MADGDPKPLPLVSGDSRTRVTKAGQSDGHGSAQEVSWDGCRGHLGRSHGVAAQRHAPGPLVPTGPPAQGRWCPASVWGSRPMRDGVAGPAQLLARTVQGVRRADRPSGGLGDRLGPQGWP